MFGFGDMAMGAGLEMNGAMDMADGMMLTEMGMPGLGAMQMGMGAMQMGMGQNLMNLGMMENMYGGYGMGYGMGGMMAMDAALIAGCMGIGCTLACCNPGLYRHRPCMGIGCNLPCCFTGRRFGNCMGVGCTLPCCRTTTEVIVIDGNRGQQYPQYQGNNYQNQYQNGFQYQTQNQYVNQGQNQYVNQGQNQYVNQGQNRMNQNQYVNQGQYQNMNQNPQYNNRPQQVNYQNMPTTNYQNQTYQNKPQTFQNNQVKIEQPQNIGLRQQQNQIPHEQQTRTQQISNTLYPQISQYKESIYQGQQNKTLYNMNHSLADESVQMYKNQYFSKDNQGFNDISLNQNTIYHGKIFKRIGFNWTQYPQAILTKHNLLDLSVQNMTKVKVKLDTTHQNTSFLKITTSMTQDHFFGCYQKEQLEWLCSIIWVKMASVNKYSDRFAEFNGLIEGQILRKSQFLGNWQYRFVRIDGSGLKSYHNPHSLHTLHLSNIKELWCRFEYLHGGSHLVIKIKSGGVKYEYGIPVQFAFPWIKAFYSLLI